MSDRKLYAREEFEELRDNSAWQMAADEKLQTGALKVLAKAGHYRWIHRTNWFGEPIINLPQSMFAVRELFSIPDSKFMIESGVAWGGSLLFYSTLMA